MLAVGSAWKGLAAELRATALSYASALSGPSSEEWQVAASAAMVDAATPYVTWMSTTAVQALSSIFDGWNIFAPGSGSSSSGLSGLL
jgi:PPE-repeat protein